MIETFNFGVYGGVASLDAGLHVAEPVLVATAASVDEPFAVARPCVVVPHAMSLVAVTPLSGHFAQFGVCNSCNLANIDEVAGSGEMKTIWNRERERERERNKERERETHTNRMGD